MTIYHKAKLLRNTQIALLVFAIGMGVIWGEVFFLVFITLAMLSAAISHCFRCPRCKTPVRKEIINIYGKEIEVWSPFKVQKKCICCGVDYMHEYSNQSIN
jgi:hypothetical protein